MRELLWLWWDPFEWFLCLFLLWTVCKISMRLLAFHNSLSTPCKPHTFCKTLFRTRVLFILPLHKLWHNLNTSLSESNLKPYCYMPWNYQDDRLSHTKCSIWRPTRIFIFWNNHCLNLFLTSSVRNLSYEIFNFSEL